jgi:catechol 2,3-dioxygenase-like lactoylglutathione lyase family enzyme
MIDHVGIQCDDLARSRAFYDATLGALGYRSLMDFGEAVGYGSEFPVFWLGAATDAVPNRQGHFAFSAGSREAVQEFYAAALRLGAESLHEPRLWPEYHPGYYGAFVRDPDGNNVEAVHHSSGGTTED